MSDVTAKEYAAAYSAKTGRAMTEPEAAEVLADLKGRANANAAANARHAAMTDAGYVLTPTGYVLETDLDEKRAALSDDITDALANLDL